jgi:hypothetical protein
MILRRLFLLMILCLGTIFPGNSQVKIISDTDHGGDADDQGALVCSEG